MKILVTDLAGKEHEVEGTKNWTIMELIRDAGLPMRAECGGSCACATCHVYVDDAWLAKTGDKSAMEESMLDFAENVEPNSRLACQIKMTDALDGLVVRLPESQH